MEHDHKLNQNQLSAVRQAMEAYSPGDLLGLSDLHEALHDYVESNQGSQGVEGFTHSLLTIERQLSGGEYTLDDKVFADLRGLLDGAVSADGKSEYLSDFALEMKERLSRAQAMVMDLEQPGETESVVELFRLFHTVKGEAGFLDLPVLAELFHALENLLDGLRSGKLTVSNHVTDRLFEGLDLAEAACSRLTLATPKWDELRPAVAALREAIDGLLASDGEQTSAEPPVGAPEVTVSGEKSQHQEENLVKVSGKKLSALVDLVSEMLIVQNQLRDETKEAQQLRKVSREVQQAAMSLRTTPLKPLFVKMKRAVRDLARQQGKEVTVSLVGEGQEIDRALAEALEEPLVHLVRNCLGHGIETADVRRGKGKAEAGRVDIWGERRGNYVVLGIRDDGQGLNAEAILASAVKGGKVSKSRAATLREAEIFELIFQDGLSTATKVDDIAGRGVGMSIVKKTVERFRGSIDIKTEVGAFTQFSLIFPLSSALLDGMIVEVRGERFILPVANIVESVSMRADSIQQLGSGARVLQLRGNILPVIDLGEFFFGTEKGNVPAVGVIVEDNLGSRSVLLVDSLVDKREVVIKSLGTRFRNLKGISAGAILRGGEIGFLVEVDKVVQSLATLGDAS